MFKILDGREHFYQWDLNQKIIVEDNTIVEVHFSNGSKDALVCRVYDYADTDIRVVNVPNILLQSDLRLKVYAYTGDYTKVEQCFKVIGRAKPTDYVYTETEVETYEYLVNRLNEIEEKNVSDEAIKLGVEAYLEANPYEKGATAEEAAQIEANKQAIESLERESAAHATTDYVDSAIRAIDIPEVDLTGYATEKYVDNAMKSIDIPEVDLTGYATEKYVDNAMKSIDVPEVDLTGYAKSSEIPSKLSQLTNDKGFITEVPSEYITEKELNQKGYLTVHQDLSGYAKKTDLPNLDNYATVNYVNTVVDNAIVGGEVDLNNYYTKEQVDKEIDESILALDMPDVSEFMTVAQVQALIDSTLVEVANGAY